jgi:hypothetical protein
VLKIAPYEGAVDLLGDWGYFAYARTARNCVGLFGKSPANVRLILIYICYIFGMSTNINIPTYIIQERPDLKKYLESKGCVFPDKEKVTFRNSIVEVYKLELPEGWVSEKSTDGRDETVSDSSGELVLKTLFIRQPDYSFELKMRYFRVSDDIENKSEKRNSFRETRFN